MQRAGGDNDLRAAKLARADLTNANLNKANLSRADMTGATLIGAPAAAPLAAALEATWRRDPSLYYEDGFQELADRGGAIGVAPIGEVEWVEVDNHDDLRRAREIAARC